MNLPRGTLKDSEEWNNARPMDYFSKVESHFSGVIRFFERGSQWNVFFLLCENGSLIGYYTTRGETPLEEKLHSIIEGFEVEVRIFTETEMEIARNLNFDYLLPNPVKISEIVSEDMSNEIEAASKVKDLFPDTSFLAEIRKARQFKEDFNRRRTKETSS